MKICSRGINWIQIINEEGECCACCWAKNNIVGNLLHQDIKEIMHSVEMQEFQKALVDGTYSNCDVDNCPYLANGRIDEILVDVDDLPNFPTELHLAYEGVCNYNCTCCSSYAHMQDAKKNDYTVNYELIENKLKDILPHVKKLGANGRGELFASKRILKLLSEWKPLAPREEVKVVLETNGSLFDEKHWKMIENLGQYNLSVGITVMSFNEITYQHLSGTSLPITRIEDNLRFVKKLREQDVINYLELATVLQEGNFREMPEFVERCIEEFGADKVRIRPIMPGGIYDNNIQWFMDVRNPEHPYYEQYVKVMQHPVFKHPKVLLWSGSTYSARGKHPGIKSKDIQRMVDKLLVDLEFINNLENEVGSKSVSLYGLGTIGKLLLKLNNGQIDFNQIIDNYSKEKVYMGIPVNKESDIADKSRNIVIAVYDDKKQIMDDLRRKGFTGKIYNLYSIIEKEHND